MEERIDNQVSQGNTKVEIYLRPFTLCKTKEEAWAIQNALGFFRFFVAVANLKIDNI